MQRHGQVKGRIGGRREILGTSILRTADFQKNLKKIQTFLPTALRHGHIWGRMGAGGFLEHFGPVGLLLRSLLILGTFSVNLEILRLLC